jgi:tetratricopeptide (TPR) repeat protein
MIPFTVPLQAQELLWKAFFDAGESALSRGDYAEAERQLQSALKDAETFGKKDARLLMTLRTLAVVYDNEGKYSQAESLLQRTWVIDQKAGAKHRKDLAQDLNYLATVYVHKGNDEEAEPLYKQSQTILEKISGADQQLASTLRNLAMLYANQGRYQLAEPLLKRALTICEKASSEPDADTAETLEYLAKLYNMEGRVSEAEPLYKKVLTAKVKAIGPINLSVARTLSELGTVYEKEGKLPESEALLKRACAVVEQECGSSGLQLAEPLMAMAGLLQLDGRNKEAIKLLQRALAIRQSALPENDPKIAESTSKLASAYFAACDYDKSEDLYNRAIHMDECSNNNASLANDLNSIALLNVAQGKYNAAKLFYKRALSITTEKLGLAHPNVAACFSNLAFLYENQGKYKEAEPLLKEALAIREKALGSNSPAVAQSLTNLATIYASDNRLFEAEQLLARALEIEESKLGTDHPDVADIRNNLAQVYVSEKKTAEAEACLQKLLARDERILGPAAPAVAGDLDNLAKVLVDEGKNLDAQKLRERSNSIKSKLPGALAAAPLDESTPFGGGAGHRLPLTDKWAVVIGISNYKDSSINLKYASKDAADFRNYLVNYAHFNPKHVTLLTDANATRDNIIAKLSELGRVAKPNDLLVVYVSTHGSPSKKEVGGINFIVPYEGTMSNIVLTGLPMQWFTTGLKDILHGNRLVLLLDVCHSGAAAEEDRSTIASLKTTNGKQQEEGQKGLRRVVDISRLTTGEGQIVLASSASDQISWESRNYPNSVFTRRLIEGLRLKGDQTTLLEAYEYMRDRTQEEVLRDRAEIQTPVLMKQRWLGEDVVLGATPTNDTNATTERNNERSK